MDKKPAPIALPAAFGDSIGRITAYLQGKALDASLESALNIAFPADGDAIKELTSLCRQGCDEGWLCNREAGGIKFGRVIKPTPSSHDYSVDVVDMKDVVGPHHAHPNGEIDLVMPFNDTARFDGVATGWKVYPPGSAHNPTVSDGRALVLYLLPQGAIEFTRTA